MKKIIFGLLFCGIIFRGVSLYYDSISVKGMQKFNETLKRNLLNNEHINRINASTNSKTLAEVVSQIEDSSLKSKANLKLAHLSLKEADILVRNAREMQIALNTEDMTPVMEKFLSKAIEQYASSKAILDSLDVSPDSDFNFQLHFLRGNINYRYLQAFADQNTVAEYFNQTINNYKEALKIKEGDTSTVINIEQLLSNYSSFASAADNGETVKRKVLNQVGKSILRGN